MFVSVPPPEWVIDWLTNKPNLSTTAQSYSPSTAPSSSPPSAALEKRYLSIQDGINEQFQSLMEYFTARAQLLRKNPFAENMSALLANIKLHKTDNRFILVDSSHRYVYLWNRPASMTDMIAISGGESFSAFITGHNEAAFLLAFWNNEIFFPCPEILTNGHNPFYPIFSQKYPFL